MIKAGYNRIQIIKISGAELINSREDPFYMQPKKFKHSTKYLIKPIRINSRAASLLQSNSNILNQDSPCLTIQNKHAEITHLCN